MYSIELIGKYLISYLIRRDGIEIAVSRKWYDTRFEALKVAQVELRKMQ